MIGYQRVEGQIKYIKMRVFGRGIFRQNLLESPPVSVVPLKRAGAPVHTYDILGRNIFRESCISPSRLVILVSGSPMTSSLGTKGI